MARFDTSGLDDLIREMQKMGETSGPVAEVMVTAAVQEIKEAWRESAEAHHLRKTGDMIESIGYPEPARRIGDVIARDVYPQGKDRKGVRNTEKAFINHYGTTRQKPTYWVDDADEISGPRVQARLEAIWGEYLKTGKVPTIPDAADDSGGITKTVK